MKIYLLLCASLLFSAEYVSALPLFPRITNAPLSATTNQEVSRAVASDGTNFLVVVRGDHLYANAHPSNQLAAFVLDQDGEGVGARRDLHLNGSVPIVAFGTSNYLLVWIEEDAEPVVRGQLLTPNGFTNGAAFVIASNVNATEVSSIAYGLGKFWVCWPQTNVANEARIVVQRVLETGSPVGNLINVGSPTSPIQQFHVISAGRSNVLVAWSAQKAATNAWEVLACYLDADGNAAPAFPVSETPAMTSSPVGASSDGTNHFVVWSREDAPTRFIRQPGMHYWEFTTNTFAYLFGRVLGASNAPEFSLSRARWGQVAPTVAFDGTNYLVAWLDRRFAGYRPEWPVGWGTSWAPPSETNVSLFFAFVAPNGDVIDHEFIAHQPTTRIERTAELRMNIAVNARTAVLVRTVKNFGQQDDDVEAAMLLPRRNPHVPVKIVGMVWADYVDGTNRPYVRVAFPTNHTHFMTQWSSNMIDWVTPKHYAGWFPGGQQAAFLPSGWYPIGGWDFVDVPIVATPLFIRGIEDTPECHRGLRKIARRKETWALVNDRYPGDTAVDTDLWTSLADRPECPIDAWQERGLIGELPRCVRPEHVFP